MIRGNCYTSAEALFHILGAYHSDWRPYRLKTNGDTHWFLKNSAGVVLDPSRLQFLATPPYSEGTKTGFLTRRPSKKAFQMMEQLTWQRIPSSELTEKHLRSLLDSLSGESRTLLLKMLETFSVAPFGYSSSTHYSKRGKGLDSFTCSPRSGPRSGKSRRFSLREGGRRGSDRTPSKTA